MMRSIAARWRPLLLAGASLPLAVQAAQGAVCLEPEGSGLAVTIAGAMKGMDAEQFSRVVLSSIPEELLNRQSNFTQHAAYKPEERYELVLVFHDPAHVVEADLCAADRLLSAPPPPPEFESLRSPVGLTGALCVGNAPVTVTSNKAAGSVTPDQVSFRFLVADTVKTLFPDGFSRLPRKANVPR